MRFGRVFVISISTALLISTPGFAAIKSGVACKKVGQTTISNGKKYTCVKSGKKLTWNAGVAVNKPSGTTAPALPKEPTSLLDIKDYEQVIYWAWKKGSEKIAGNVSKTNEAEIVIGPNSGILNKNPIEATQITSKLFAGQAQPSKITFISYSFEDVAWAQKQIEARLEDSDLLNLILSPSRGGPNNALATCPTFERCHSSQTFTNRSGKSLVIAGFTPSRLTNEGESKGQLQSHEFTHIVQQHQFIGTQRELDGLSSLKMYLPWWLVEGGADFGGFISKYNKSYSEYKTARMRDVLSAPNKTSQWFEEFINPPTPEFWVRNNSSGEIYNVGFMVIEILSAIKGPDVQMQIIKSVANGMSMDEAFEKEFGIPWKSAVPIIAKLIADERAKY